MATESPIPAAANTGKITVPSIIFPDQKKSTDFTTILGLFFAVTLIFMAIAMGQSDASFFNFPAITIVVLGTMAVTAASFTGQEIKHSLKLIGKTLSKKQYPAKALARSLIEMAVVAKKVGVLSLSKYDDDLSKHKFLKDCTQMAIDGQSCKDIDFILSQEIAALIERHKRATSMTKRASETAPAMGLIGTLVGLVQMLADLENPETIGPAMAVALLTTFYGAILGSVIMAPLSGKLEKNSTEEALNKNMIRIFTISVARQDNPRKLEMELNSILPPAEKIKYFD